MEFTSGYRLYKGVDGKLRFTQIIGGASYEFVPTPEDLKMKQGYYDPDMNYLDPQPAMPKAKATA